MSRESSADEQMNSKYTCLSKSKFAKTVTLMTCILEVSSSNFGWHTDYHGRLVVVFLIHSTKRTGLMP
jgi:hypothetical protein